MRRCTRDGSSFDSKPAGATPSPQTSLFREARQLCKLPLSQCAAPPTSGSGRKQQPSVAAPHAHDATLSARVDSRALRACGVYSPPCPTAPAKRTSYFSCMWPVASKARRLARSLRCQESALPMMSAGSVVPRHPTAACNSLRPPKMHQGCREAVAGRMLQRASSAPLVCHVPRRRRPGLAAARLNPFRQRVLQRRPAVRVVPLLPRRPQGRRHEPILHNPRRFQSAERSGRLGAARLCGAAPQREEVRRKDAVGEPWGQGRERVWDKGGAGG